VPTCRFAWRTEASSAARAGSWSRALRFALLGRTATYHVEALVTVVGVNLLLWATIAYETFVVYDERRYRLRHGLTIDVPGS
jgi:hypothetical protein